MKHCTECAIHADYLVEVYNEEDKLINTTLFCDICYQEAVEDSCGYTYVIIKNLND